MASKRGLTKKIVLVITCLLLLGVVALVAHLRAKTSGPVVTQTSSAPDESPIDKTTASYQWQGSPKDPKYLDMPSIQASGYIQKVGVDKHNQIAAPSNIHLAGWYVKSAQPGAPGLSVIDGHINGLNSRDGIFKNLTKLQAGDKFTVERGDNMILNYQVMTVQTIHDSDTLSILFSQDSKTPSQLNLISCAGDFDAKSHSYDKRVIVSARLR